MSTSDKHSAEHAHGYITVRRNQDRKAPDIARRQSWVRVVGSGSS